MDLGIAGRRALVCASSRGLGRACALALAREGASVWINGRNAARLEETQAQIHAATGARVAVVPADLSSGDGRAALLAACPEPDILVTNNAGPPRGPLADHDEAAWLAAVQAHMLGPIALMRAVLPGMRERGFGRIVAITSAQVMSPSPDMPLSIAPRAGLMALIRAVQAETAGDNVTINSLLPGPFRTDRLEGRARQIAQEHAISLEEAFERLGRTRTPAGRIGDPAEFGDACAYLCSAQAGFLSGQSLALNGGA